MKLGFYNKEVFLFDGSIVETGFNSESRQLFTHGGVCYILYKDTKTVYRIKYDTYITLLLKLNHLVETYIKYETPTRNV